MDTDALISARVAITTKERFVALARHQGVSESALLKRLVDGALATSVVPLPEALPRMEPIALSGKLSVRLRPDDFLLLRERAKARSLPTATYVSYLIRSHLRSLAPLPTQELAALKRSIAEVGAIGRNVNQIAFALNRGESPSGLTRADAQALLRALTGLRNNIKDLVTVNLSSWEAGYEKTTS